MDDITIEGVILTPLKKIYHSKGNIFHGIKKSDIGFMGFGEAYFSTIKDGQIKGWNKHKRMTLNLVVPIGIVVFVIYDDRVKSSTNGNILRVILSVGNYQRLTIPQDLWIAFRGESQGTNLILNVADIEHDPEEVERVDLDKIIYNWDDI